MNGSMDMDRELTYRAALTEALAAEMERDGRVFLLGLGIGARGGSFGVTRGLMDRFGAERVIDTPISEASFTGMAIGAAIQGKRPVVELTYIDFSMLAMDTLINQAAKYHFVTGDLGTVPLVVRTQGGAGTGTGAQHSQSLEAFFYHVPGFRVAVPATPEDARGLLVAAIRDDDPVIFIEHKLLYNTTGPVPDRIEPIPFGRATIRREGGDCTIVAYSRMANLAVDAADSLALSGIDCDVLDLRTLVPMDREAIRASVEKTGRLVVASEAVLRGSVASDIAGWAAEQCFDALRAPVQRVCGKITTIPYNERLERFSVPGAGDIAAAVHRIAD